MEAKEDKQTKILNEVSEIIQKYSNNTTKEIINLINNGNPNDKIDETVMKKLIHNQHQSISTK